MSCVLAPLSSLAATFSLTPASADNTYTGTVTLNIGGLTNGEPVIIQNFLDLNANSAVEAGEPMMDSFRLVDGGTNLIGGIVNRNVPFDSNSATGAIAAILNVAPPRPLGNIVGQLIYRVSSPNGNFTPVTATFTVTNAALNQTVSGTIYSNGVAAVPYGLAVVLAGGGDEGGEYLGGVVADANGYFQLNLNPGPYMLLPVVPGYFTDQSLAPQFNLTSGMSSTNNLFLTNGSSTISGTVHDAGNSNNLTGVFLMLEGGDLFSIAFTDTNGNYSAGVGPGQWQVRTEDSALARRSYVSSRNGPQVDSSTGSVANVNLALPKATAMFYGVFTNLSGTPFTNYRVSVWEPSDQFETSGFTDASGRYSVAVLGGTNVWQCSPDTESLSSYIVSSGESTNLSVGQALQLDFVAIPATNHISGYVRDNNSQPITDLSVSAWATLNGVNFNANTRTDGSGNYSLNVANGNWTVNVDCGAIGPPLNCPGQKMTNVLNADVVVNFVVSDLQVTTSGLPDATQGVFYSQALAASGGEAPYTWSLSPGWTNLPFGLALATNGVLSGTPTGYGSTFFGVRVTDNLGATADEFFNLNINPAPLQITTTSLPNGTNGQFYFQNLAVSGGSPPYTWYLPDGSSVLPPGLNLNTNGFLTGTPTTNGVFNFNVSVYVNNPYQVDTQFLSLTIAAGPLQITTTSPLPSATRNSFYSTTLAAAGGQPPYTWSLSPLSPPLPAGLLLSTNGVLSGTPTVAGGFWFIARVTDSLLATNDWMLGLTINEPAPQGPTLTAPMRPAPGQFQFSFNTATGTNYTIQFSSDLTTWTSVLTISGSGYPLTIIDPNATVTQRFYRLKIGP